MIIIILFIIILNAVSILLMYRSLNNLTSKEKLIYIAAGTVIMYLLTSLVYWISTRNIEITEVSSTGKDLIIFLFVPINGIVVLPLFAKSYSKFRANKLSSRVLRNRGIALGLILLIMLIIECAYFENVQKQVENMINDKNSKYYQIQQDALNIIAEANEVEGESTNGASSNTVANVIGVTNQVKGGEINENTIEENGIEEELNNEEVNVLENAAE